MKKTCQLLSNKISLFCLIMFTSAVSFAQDSAASSSSTTTTTSSSTTAPADAKMWYTQPWIWIVAAVIVILIIFLASRGSNKSGASDTVTVKRTVTRETDTV